MKGFPRISRLLVGLVLVLAVTTRAWAARPNVVIVLLDDVGYGDFACLGNPILKTPQIDHLHNQSVRLTDFHVSPMCTPTRGQLLTGRDALDNGAMNVSSGRAMLRPGIPTLAETFQANGYHTGIFGKWHLGDVHPHRPQDKGFDRAIWFPSSHMSSATDYWNNDYFDPHLRLEDGTVQPFKGYCTDIFFDQAMTWMRHQARAKQPFFCYLPLNAAHAPLFVPDKYREPYRDLSHNLATFYGMIANIDENMGRLDAMLKTSGLWDDTIVIFMTDNGGTVGVKRFNAGMQGGKVTLWEGGHRVPCFVRYPAGKIGGTRADALPRDISELTQIQDLFPTLIDLCALKPPADPKFDGVNLTGLLSGRAKTLADRMLVVQFTRINTPAPVKFESAVLWRKWRLIRGVELYDVATDLPQAHNIAAQHPDIVAKMREHYERWWADVEPSVNQFTNVSIGSESEPETLLTPPDWQDVFLDQQLQVRAGLARSGPWGLNVARDGNYVFELRRWPREADAALTAEMPAFKAVDGEYPAGKALPIARAKLQIGEAEQAADVKPGDKFVRFTVPLKAGPIKAQTWFYDAAGKELCGAYYVYVHRE